MAHVMRSTLAGRAGVLEEETPDIYATPQDVVMVVRGHADDVMPIPGRRWNAYTESGIWASGNSAYRQFSE
jgi:hypothetical protein